MSRFAIVSADTSAIVRRSATPSGSSGGRDRKIRATAGSVSSWKTTSSFVGK
jgi:hypothetical protein